MIGLQQVMSTLHARSALIMELLPRFWFRLGFGKEFEVRAAALSKIVRLQRMLAVYPKLVRLKRLKATEIVRLQLSDAAVKDVPATVSECNAEGLFEADPSGRTVRRLWSYPKLVRLQCLKAAEIVRLQL